MKTEKSAVQEFDIAIVGSGVSGSAIARRLAVYDVRVALLEKDADVSFGTSKANSGIIHGGFHHNARHLKSRLEIQGNAMFSQLHRELGFPFRRSGIVVAAFNQEQMTTAEHLYRQGVENESPGIELCGAERIKELEPKLHSDVIGGLYAPVGGIIEPYRFVFSLVESAQQNGVELFRQFKVEQGERQGGKYRIRSEDGREIRSEFVVNAAGLFADEVSRMFSAEEYRITPRKGEYHLLDRRTNACPQKVVFPVPTPVSKGMLVIPTVEGTVLIGPTAHEIDDKQDVSTSRERMDGIIASAKQLVPSVSAADIISSFSGLRPVLPGNDFRIEESEACPGFIHVAGIQSPGLTATPAIAEYVKDLLKAAGCNLTEKRVFHPALPPVERTRVMEPEKLTKLWEENPRSANVVCRCETVSRAEIDQAIEAGHHTLDGIKFYSRAGAGRCQGAFCVPRILDVIAEQTEAKVTEVSKRGPGSEIVKDTLPGTADDPAHSPEESPEKSPGPRPEDAEVPASVDLLVVGGGAAGMAAASGVSREGFQALIVDRENHLGGVLRQCIHNGFGLHEFREELTGPEYAERWMKTVHEAGVKVLLETTVVDIRRENDGFVTSLLSRAHGPREIRSRAVSLAMGSRERNRGSIQIPGTRPAGVMTAGAAQRLINVEGYIPGKKAVIIGSGDIGLIMARRLKMIGCDVEAVIEIQPIPSGINRNIVQCLEDFSIPLYLGHVVTEIQGKNRVEGVHVAPLENGVLRSDKAFHLECDTLLLSVGLVPENELSRELGVELHAQTSGPVVDSRLMTNIPGVFASGNVLHIHDLVDYVAEESSRCSKAIVEYLQGKTPGNEVRLKAGSNVRYLAPGRISVEDTNRVYLRSMIAKVGAKIQIRGDGELLKEMKKPHVQPSEMISINVNGGDMKDYRTIEVSII
ncbi:FAD-dependent oxidoreductase [Salinispira pacifica]|uniref:Sarcosine oxidase alpha subunit n=1 Tax=Salinispira pacifica TaxID=1307761 RepID=V5WFW6_9SPIO|nr:FAD-dependent oxidoreductase [Salinispira pacifica]AHC14041.1 Sarcosine oxidase alpha subunit [Salinispira pacifica]